MRSLYRLFLDTRSPRPVARVGKTTYVVHDDDPLRDAHVLIDDFMLSFDEHGFAYNALTEIRKRPSGLRILEAEPDDQVRLVQAAVVQHAHLGSLSARQRRMRWSWQTVLDAVCTSLLRRKLPFTRDDLQALLSQVAENQGSLACFPFGLLVQTVERYLAAHGRDATLLKALRPVRDAHHLDPTIRAKLDALLGSDGPTLDRGDAVGDALQLLLDALDDAAQAPWNALLMLAAQQGHASRPSQRFLKESGTCIDAIGEAPYREVLTRLLDAAAQLKPQEYWFTNSAGGAYTSTALLARSSNETILRSLAWTAAHVPAPSLSQVLGRLARTAFTTVPGLGPVAVKVGNGCFWALGALPGLHGAAELVRLREQIKHAQSHRLIDRYLDATADREGLTRADLADLAVATHGLTTGELHEPVGPFTAELIVASPTRTVLRWRKPDGTLQPSVPAQVKREHPAVVKALRKTAKDIRSTLSAQRSRIEQFYLEDRTMTVGVWRERLLEHGLLYTLATRLIWTVGQGPTRTAALWRDGRFVDAHDRPLSEPGPEEPVRLWHPLDGTTEDVLAWRAFIDRHEIRQPFKQAYREVYLLTDAERATEIYSNRFAAHILRQHQFSVLAKTRGWSYGLLGAYDNGRDNARARRSLPAWNLDAGFWVDEVYAEDAYNDTGIWHYVATDQVRFVRDGEPLRLDEVPPLVFSEIMRDADLFVGVASIGNDPAWQDHGADRHLQPLVDYWHRFAFGELSATAQTRKDVLQKLIPRLAIAPRCTFEGRFLIVRGDVRTYKIHLGSGNILMEPNDQYLCIVPDRRDRSAGDRLFLPFEGDATLSLILSKAFLLAADTTITDRTILRQIRR